MTLYCEECKNAGRERQATFGYSMSIACKEHCKDGMINTAEKHKVCTCGSRKRKRYATGFNDRPSHCGGCRSETMFNVSNPRCRSNQNSVLCTQTANAKYDGYCTHCFANLFPDDARTPLIRKPSKEIRVAAHLMSKSDEWKHNRLLSVDMSGGCCATRRVIDLRRIVHGTMLCVEVDENQHRSYCSYDDFIRYNEFLADVTMRFVFIRYNPDPYKNSTNRRVDPPFEERMEKLERLIEKEIQDARQHDTEQYLVIRYLYYDEDQSDSSSM